MDSTILGALALHVGVAVILTALQCSVGTGALIFLSRSQGLSAQTAFFIGYPIGVLILYACAVMVLASPISGVVAFALLLTCLVAFAGWASRERSIRPVFGLLATIAPAAAALAAYMGAVWHGPTDTLAAKPLLDMIFYAGLVDSFDTSLFPIPNLAVEGESFAFNNMFPSMIVAAVGKFLTMDPFLSLACWTNFSYVIFFALGFYFIFDLFVTDRFGIAVLLLFSISAIYNPVYAVNSVPFAMSIPLIFGGYFLSRLIGMEGRVYNLIGWIATGAATAFAKVTLLLYVLSLIPMSQIFSIKRMNFTRLIITLFIFLLLSAYCILMLYWYGAGFYAHFLAGGGGPSSLPVLKGLAPITDRVFLAWVLRDAGLLLLLCVSPFVGNRPVCLAIASGCVSHLFFPYLFLINPIASMLVAAIAVINFPRGSRPVSIVLLASSTLLACAALSGDPYRFTDSLVAALCVGTAVLAAVAIRAENWNYGKLIKPPALFGFSVSIAIAVAVAVGSGNLGRGDPRSYASVESLNPTYRGALLALREITPEDSLIFTEFTGYDGSLMRGFNLYAMFARRQFYLAGPVLSSLWNDAAKRDERLKINREVLAGALTPASVDFSRSYRAYYALVSTTTSVPSAWRSVFRNRDYAIFAIVSSEL